LCAEWWASKHSQNHWIREATQMAQKGGRCAGGGAALPRYTIRERGATQSGHTWGRRERGAHLGHGGVRRVRRRDVPAVRRDLGRCRCRSNLLANANGVGEFLAAAWRRAALPAPLPEPSPPRAHGLAVALGRLECFRGLRRWLPHGVLMRMETSSILSATVEGRRGSWVESCDGAVGGGWRWVAVGGWWRW
jgi:hypothetical protein